MLCTVSDEGVYAVNCEMCILDKRNAVMQFVIDTGASITCCRAKELGINFSEEDFVANNSNIRYMNGVLKEGDRKKDADRYSIKLYEVKLKRFQVGTLITVENVSVWVTFDRRFYICLMGQDLLERLYYLHLRSTKELYITDNIVDLKQYMDSV